MPPSKLPFYYNIHNLNITTITAKEIANMATKGNIT